MPATLSPAMLQKLLIDDLAHASKLEELLEGERQQLEKRNSAALDQLLSLKARLLAEIEKNDSVRKSLLEESGFTADRKGLKECCENLDRQAINLGRQQKGDTLSELSKQLHEQLQRCRDLSEINGSIVHRSRSNTLRLLDILRGKGISNDGTYTASGITDREHNSRNLGNV